MPQMRQIGKHETKVLTKDGYTRVWYHQTAVISFSNKEIILDTGGWKTSTTKTRMNQASSQFDLGFSVRQEKGYWIATYKGTDYHFIGDILTLPRL